MKRCGETWFGARIHWSPMRSPDDGGRKVALGESITIRAQPSSPDSQPWGFIPLEIGIVSAEEQGLQAVSVRNNRAGNPLPLDLEELSQSVDRGDNLPVNQRVILG